MSLRSIVALLAWGTVALGAGWAIGLRLNLTESIPSGFYREHAPTADSIRRGAVVLACLPLDVAKFARMRGYLPRGSCPGGTMPVGKIVIATVGDTVTLCDSGIRVNGDDLLMSRPLLRDHSGRWLPQFARGLYVVAPGTIWLGSRSDAGFDSRYFGAVPSSSIVAILARP
jgi:conjugative transfer signal peptidase TraF